MKTFYLTTPIYYPNARPHVGSAYTTIACDAIARYKRMCGYDVAFLTGTDEHGEKIQRAADAAGIPVEKFVTEKRELFKDLWQTLGISEYKFIHTSQNPTHRAAVEWMIRQADRAGYIEKKKYEGRYCIYDERYVSDSPEPVNCDICSRPAELISEDNYFFKLSAFGPSKPGAEDGPLMELYKRREKDPTFAPFVLPDFRMNEVKSFVKSGLRDISISRRRLKWGVPWPGDDEQVVYVWYDALTSYLSGIGFEGEKQGKDFEKYWPADVHMIGKDILRFHAVYWPAFLWAAGLPLPKTIFAHGWIYYEQDKMSKSKGNVVYPEPIIKAFEEFGAPGTDALRYYLLRDTPFGLDGSFSYEGLIQRYNSDLANDLGNLASRTITMIIRYCGGAVPEPQIGLTSLEMELKSGTFGGRHESAGQIIDCTGEIAAYQQHFHRFELAPALLSIWTLISMINGYLVKRQPWKLAESSQEIDRAALGLVLYTAADLLRTTTALLYPFVPESAVKLWKQLGCEEHLGKLEEQRVDQLNWAQLKPGTRVGKPEPVFPRLDKEKTLARLRALAEEDAAAEKKSKESKVESQPEQKPVAVAPVSTPAEGVRDSAAPDQKITIDDFAKIDLRVGTILSAESIPGATKLLKLQVDIGVEVRQVCAGIAEHYQPEQLTGMKIVLVANLQPRKLRGVESNGMILAASVGESGKPVLATFKEDVPNGTKLK